MTSTLALSGTLHTPPIDAGAAIQELVRLQLQLQTRIAAVRNAADNDLSYQTIQDYNLQIKILFEELENKLQVRNVAYKVCLASFLSSVSTIFRISLSKRWLIN